MEIGVRQVRTLTTEYAVKGEFADYGIRIDKQLVAFIEVKRTTTKLSERHLRQVEMYAVNEGVEWMLLTNGGTWQAYHLSPGMPVQIDLALDVDLLGDGTVNQKSQLLFYLTLESMKRRQIDDLWRAKRASSPKSLAGALLQPSVVDAIRREIRRATGHTIESPEIAKLLRETVVREDCF